MKISEEMRTKDPRVIGNNTLDKWADYVEKLEGSIKELSAMIPNDVHEAWAIKRINAIFDEARQVREVNHDA